MSLKRCRWPGCSRRLEGTGPYIGGADIVSGRRGSRVRREKAVSTAGANPREMPSRPVKARRGSCG